MLKVVHGSLVVQNGEVVGRIVEFDLPVEKARTCKACGEVVPVREMAKHLKVCGDIGWGSLRHHYGKFDLSPPESRRKRRNLIDVSALKSLLANLP